MADDSGRLNDILAETAFLGSAEGGFVEAMRERWLADPATVDASWGSLFQALGEDRDTISGPSVEPPAWPSGDRPEWLSAIDGRWPEAEGRVAERIASGHAGPRPPGRSAPARSIPFAPS